MVDKDSGDAPGAPYVCPRAERLLQTHIRDLQAPSCEEVQRLAQECETQRTEVERQNEELRRAHQQLEQYRDRYVDLYDFAPLGYVTLDEDGYVQEINLAGAKLLATDRNTLTGYPLLDYVAVEDRPAFKKHLHQCVQQRQEVTSEIALGAKDGQVIQTQLRSIPVEGHEPGTVFCKTAITDITHRKQTEEQLKTLNDTLEQRVAQRTAEVEQRAAQLRALALQLSQTEERERRRLAQVLHKHLQQLLILAKIKVDSMIRHAADPAVARAMADIRELLEQSVTETRSLTIELSSPIVYEYGLAAALKWLAGHMGQKHSLPVEVDVDPQAEPAEEGLRVFLFQAVRELLFNVVQHAQAERAWVTMAKAGNGRVQIEVRDEGAGFDAARLASAHTRTHARFGLSSIRERLELLDGRMEIRSSPGGGTRVAMTAPLRRSSQSAPPNPPARRQSVPQAEASAGRARAQKPGESGKTRVVLADDHPVLRQGLADLLEKEPQIDVVGQARDGEEAVAVALETRPDVVLMDVSMPKLSGIEATRRIKAELPMVRIIGLSMYDEGEMPDAMREAGAVTYLSKAAAADTLIATVLGQP